MNYADEWNRGRWETANIDDVAVAAKQARAVSSAEADFETGSIPIVHIGDLPVRTILCTDCGVTRKRDEDIERNNNGVKVRP